MAKLTPEQETNKLLADVKKKAQTTSTSHMDIAETSGLYHSQVTKMLNAKNVPTLTNFIKLCRSLNLKVKLEEIKLSILVVFLLAAFTAKSQTVDTIIDKGIYQSYFNYGLRQPVIVTYTLYAAGGTCSRAGDRFTNDSPLQTATQADYDHSGYDEGHLADSKDFAYNCEAQKSTFQFYNCVPQTPNLNRGIWKHWEGIIREESQRDSLLIVTGSVFDSTVVGRLHVPLYCWKVVKSHTTKEITHILYCSNTMTGATCTEVSDLVTLYTLLNSEEVVWLRKLLN